MREGKRRQFNYIGIFTYWVNWIHATANMSIQKNVTTIQYIGYVALKIVEIGSMPLHHVFRQKIFISPQLHVGPTSLPSLLFPLPLSTTVDAAGGVVSVVSIVVSERSGQAAPASSLLSSTSSRSR